jgi:hypothetical protein
MTDDVGVEQLGPVDYLVVEFPLDKANFSGEMAEKLKALVDSGTIRVLDLLILHKAADGSVEAFEVDEYEHNDVAALRDLESLALDLLAEEDVEAIADALEGNTVAAVLVWENAWAAPFASSVRRSGGQLVASGRIPVQAILAVLEADMAATEGA